MNTKLLALFLVPLAAACSSGTIAKAALDDEVRRLCAIDGGVKVYETVTLPPGKFDKYGNIHIPSKANAKADDKYYRQWDVYYYRQGNPELSKDHFQIVRRSDGKILGEAIYYGRGGGDIPGPWHDSSFKCPDPTKQPSLESSIFIQYESKGPGSN
jgi:hypothetical protein